MCLKMNLYAVCHLSQARMPNELEFAWLQTRSAAQEDTDE